MKIKNNNNNNRFISTNGIASASIIIARIFYGVNWFNVAAIFSLIALNFNQDIALLGSISAAFFIGVGIFQIPAGVFAAKYSPRTSAISGIALSSVAALLQGFSSEALQLVWLRFIVGAGMALFFSSGVILIARYANTKSPGFSIGLMNSAHSVGGIIGIFVWIIIAQMVGWRLSLILSGAIGIITAILMIIAIPSKQKIGLIKGSFASVPNKLRVQAESNNDLRNLNILRILSNGSLIALGIVLTGAQAAWGLVLTFIVVYLQNLNLSHEGTGAVASMALISSIISAPLIGSYHDRIKATKKILLICGIGISIPLAAISTGILSIIVVSVIAVGFFSGGAFTVAYAKARKMNIIISKDQNIESNLPNTERGFRGNNFDKTWDYGTLNVAWINGLSLLGVLWMPIVFSFTVKSWGGYPTAWLISGMLTALFTIIPLGKVSK